MDHFGPFLPLIEAPRALAASVPVVLLLNSGLDVMALRDQCYKLHKLVRDGIPMLWYTKELRCPAVVNIKVFTQASLMLTMVRGTWGSEHEARFLGVYF